jgi:hypothetical protein
VGYRIDLCRGESEESSRGDGEGFLQIHRYSSSAGM